MRAGLAPSGSSQIIPKWPGKPHPRAGAPRVFPLTLTKPYPAQVLRAGTLPSCFLLPTML